MIDILVEKNKSKYLSNIEIIKDELWNKYFNIFKLKNYVFDHTIITDGYSASVRFIHKDRLQEENDKKTKKKAGKEKYKGLTKEEKEALKKKLEKEKKPIPKPILKEKLNYIEFPYIDEVDRAVLRGKHIFIDPGKRDLLSVINDKGKRFTYSNKQRMKETKRLKYQRLIKNLRDKLGICTIENTLSEYNSKTCSRTRFKKYIKEKNEVNDDLFKLYENKKFRQYRWYAFINKKRTEDHMLNIIEKKFGKNLIVIHGDWCVTKQMRNFISTPNLGIKRKLKERFKIFNIDEYRTSCLHHKTEERCKNLYLPDRKGKLRKLHSVLTFKMENNRKGCINRDYNGCMNIRKLFNAHMNNEPRPQKYCRGYKLKTANPKKLDSKEFKLLSNSSRLEKRKGISSESAFIKNVKNS